MRRARNTTNDQSIEEDTKLLLLLCKLNNKVSEAKASELVVTGSSWNVVRLATLLRDIVHSLLCGSFVADVEGLVVKTDVAAHQTGEQDVAGLVVERRVDRNPFLLYGDCFETRGGCCSGDGASVVTLYAADRDESVAAFRDGIGNEIL